MRKITNVTDRINLLALTLSVWSLSYMLGEMFITNRNMILLVSFLSTLAVFFWGIYYITSNSDSTKAWDDEED